MEDFPMLLRTLETPVVGCLQDLRSQVVREACITVAYVLILFSLPDALKFGLFIRLCTYRYLSQEIGNKFDHFAEMAMPPLLNLIPNSAKIMSTSGVTAIGFIIRVSSPYSSVFFITSGFKLSFLILEHLCLPRLSHNRRWNILQIKRFEKVSAILCLLCFHAPFFIFYQFASYQVYFLSWSRVSLRN